jgi:hypothetical protein
MSFVKLKQNLIIQYFLIKQKMFSYGLLIARFFLSVFFKIKTIYELNKGTILFYMGFTLFFTAIALLIYFFLVDGPQVIKGYRRLSN